jgi:hypothetical protein
MKIILRAMLGVGALLTAPSGISAIDIDFNDADFRRAVTIASSSENARARFHESYRVPVNDSTVEQIEVITEFRRFVMASEDESLLGNWMIARGGFDSKGRTLKQVLQPFRGRVSIRTRVRFPPLHAYVAMPAVDIMIGEPSYLPLDATRTPIISNTDGVGAGPGSMTGAVIETFFNAASFHDRTLPLRIVFEGKELVRVPVDFSKLE